MVIKSLYKDYFQKSRVFLYPALDIKRGVSVTPIETYVAWEGYYTQDDCKLICLYHLRNDEDFKTFERVKLLGNKRFHDFKQVDDNKGVYVFDFSDLKKDWNAFLTGKYSQFSTEHKRNIKTYIGKNNPNLPYVESFLYPETYFKLYAEMMNVNEKLLRKVGELCSIPDIKNEILDISIKDLSLKEKID